MELTWHSHSCFEIGADDGTTVLVDPFLEVNGMTDATPDDFDPDAVALTHGHFDHVADAHKFDAPVLGQPEVTTYVESQGHDDTVDFNIGGTYEVGDVALTMVQGFHSSSTPGEDSQYEGYAGTSNGYVVEADGVTFYHAGDTGLFGDMKHVIRDVFAPDVAAVPAGGHYTMGPEHAALAVDWTGADHAFPIHYDTTPTVEIDVTEFVDAVSRATVHTPDPGETVSF